MKGQEKDCSLGSTEKRRCDGSHECPAERHIFGCFRSTLADDTEGHPNWLYPSSPENVEET